MTIERSKLEATFEEYLRLLSIRDWRGLTTMFTDDGTFFNSLLPEPVVGRAALLSFAETWNNWETHVEWLAVDGSRLVFGWNQRPEGEPADGLAYRGFSTLVFNDDGLIESYEGMLDTAQVMAATSAFAQSQ